MEINFNEIVNIILQDYFNTFNVTPLSVNCFATNEMEQEYLRLRPDHKKKILLQSKKLNFYNAIAVPPLNIGDKFSIIFNYDYLKESMQSNNAEWIGTLSHEINHIVDFKEFAKITNAESYDDVEKNSLFMLWTEFNSKAKGYYFIRKYAFKNVFDESQLKYIIEKELPEQTEILINNYASTNNGYQQLYYVAHYLGRLYAFQKIFPYYFDDKIIKEILQTNDWMLEWYQFLCSHTQLQDAYKDFEEMRNILKQNFIIL